MPKLNILVLELLIQTVEDEIVMYDLINICISCKKYLAVYNKMKECSDVIINIIKYYSIYNNIHYDMSDDYTDHILQVCEQLNYIPAAYSFNPEKCMDSCDESVSYYEKQMEIINYPKILTFRDKCIMFVDNILTRMNIYIITPENLLWYLDEDVNNITNTLLLSTVHTVNIYVTVWNNETFILENSEDFIKERLNEIIEAFDNVCDYYTPMICNRYVHVIY